MTILTDNSNSASFTSLASPLVLTSNPRNWNIMITIIIHTYIYIHTYLIDRSPWGLFRANVTERNNETEQQQLLRIPTGRRQTSWLFTSAAGKLNQGLPGTNSASGQSGS